MIDGHRSQREKRKDALHFEFVDYKRFKLFQPSLLWRMSVSRLDFFKEVNLGPDAEGIRIALVGENPSRPDQYACLMTKVTVGQQYLADWILEPFLVRVGVDRVYSVVIAGILFEFYLSNQPLSPTVAQQVLSRRGEMAVPSAELRDIPILSDAANRLLSARRVRKNSRH